MSARPEFSIGDLAKAGDIKVQTVRYYEKIGLLPDVYRTSGNQRLYSQNHKDTLVFIRHSRALGFSLEQIRELLDLSGEPSQSCAEIDAIAQVHLNDVRDKIARLKDMETELQHMVTECSGGRTAKCRIIKVLSDHELCHTDHR